MWSAPRMKNWRILMNEYVMRCAPGSLYVSSTTRKPRNVMYEPRTTRMLCSVTLAPRAGRKRIFGPCAFGRALIRWPPYEPPNTITTVPGLDTA